MQIHGKSLVLGSLSQALTYVHIYRLAPAQRMRGTCSEPLSPFGSAAPLHWPKNNDLHISPNHIVLVEQIRISLTSPWQLVFELGGERSSSCTSSLRSTPPWSSIAFIFQSHFRFRTVGVPRESRIDLALSPFIERRIILGLAHAPPMHITERHMLRI